MNRHRMMGLCLLAAGLSAAYEAKSNVTYVSPPALEEICPGLSAPLPPNAVAQEAVMVSLAKVSVCAASVAAHSKPAAESKSCFFIRCLFFSVT